MSKMFYLQLKEWLMDILDKHISFEDCQALIDEYKFFLCTFSFEEDEDISIVASCEYPDYLITEDEEIYDPFFYLGTINGQSPSIDELPLKLKHEKMKTKIDQSEK